MTPELEKVRREASEKALRKLNRLDDRHTEEGFELGFQAASEYHEKKAQELVEALEYYASGVFFKIKTGQGLQPDLTKAKQALEKFRGEE